MKFLKKSWQFIVLAVVLLIIFRRWLLPGVITGGDFWYTFPSMYHQFSLFSSAWNWIEGNGFGSFNVLYQAINVDFGLPVLLFGIVLHLPWDIITRLGFFFPFLILSVFSSWYLYKKVFGSTRLWILSALIFLLNSYALIIVAGGQIVIGIAYVIAPIVLFSFIDCFEKNEEKISSSLFRKSVLAGLLLAIEIVLDLRVAYVTCFAIGIYFLIHLWGSFQIKNYGKTVWNIVCGFIIPFAVAGLVNAFWVIPALINRQNPLNELGGAYTTVGAVKFFSFAKFENTISLLHPNWPENIFGKSYFQRPEFLIIPILAFSSLLFIPQEKRKEKKLLLFFVFLSILGAFLAKGANDPFGGVYLWSFIHVPGFILFRDSTKWYQLIAISYAVLIPYTVLNCVDFARQQKIIKFKPSIIPVFVIIFLLYWIITIRQAVVGTVPGTLKSHTIPSEYIKLEKLLSSDDDFSRTLWIPSLQRYGFYSENHPAISGGQFFFDKKATADIAAGNISSWQKLLAYSSVRYVIVPYDTEGEIFLTDRKYDPEKYEKTIAKLQKIPWLQQLPNFGKLAVFENKTFEDHFWLTDPDARVSFANVKGPTLYAISVRNVRVGDRLVISDAFDQHWQVKISGVSRPIGSTPFNTMFNSFILPKSGNYTLQVTYSLQKWVTIGIVVSLVSLIFSVLLVVFGPLKRSKI